jgi:flagellin
MALYINTNVPSLEAQRNLASNSSNQAVTFQRLSSGLRINSAADDAAGLAVAEQMQADVRSYSMAERNTNNAISMVQPAEGALGLVSSILQRLRELSVQAANGDLSTVDRGYLDQEFTAMKEEITRIFDNTRFNGRNLLSGAATTVDFQVGIDNTTSDRLSMAFGGQSLTTLGIDATSLAGATPAAAQASIAAIEGAITATSTSRANFGASLNRLAVTVSNLQSMRTNLSAAHGRIRDVDVAEESSKMARNQVLMQAGTAILTQANQSPQLALSLLKG